MSRSSSDLAAVLLDELREYDGKSTAILGEIAHRWSQKPHYLEALLGLFRNSDPTTQNGASWLFKSFVEGDEPVGNEVSTGLCDQAALLNDWAAQLHVCQSVQHLTFGPVEARKLGTWVRTLLDHDRPFLRAWSLDALVGLSSFDPLLRLQAKKALLQALSDPAASVRARARKLKTPGED